MNTMRYSLFIGLCLVLTMPLAAQTVERTGRLLFGLGLGLRAGEDEISWAKKGQSVLVPGEPLMSFTASAAWILDETFRVQTEIHYVVWEHHLPEIPFDELPPHSIREEDFQYARTSIGPRDMLEIPILLAWRPPLGGFPLRVLGGPMIGFVPGGAGDARLYVLYTGQPRDLPVVELRRGDVGPIFFGLETGLQLETALSTSFALQTDIRYVHQLSPFVDEDFLTWNLPDGLRLRLGVMYRL